VIDPQELQQRQETLDQREATLDEREQLLDTREDELEAWEADLQAWESELETLADDLEAEAGALDETGMQQQQPQQQLPGPYRYNAPSNTVIREEPIFNRPAPREPTPPLGPGEEEAGRWFFFGRY
jgi:septal ring factor EnvC (AmiA/AmiB activator)